MFQWFHRGGDETDRNTSASREATPMAQTLTQWNGTQAGCLIRNAADPFMGPPTQIQAYKLFRVNTYSSVTVDATAPEADGA